MKNPTKSGLRQFSSSTKLHEKTVISSEIIPASLFSRIGNKTFLIFLVGTMLFLSSCDKEESTVPNTNDPEPTGNILVKISTLGADDDPDGYTLKVEGSPELNTDANGEYTIPNKRVGLYNVELTNISSHCAGNGNMTKEVTVTADGTTTVEFEVSCKAILRDRIVYAKGSETFNDFKYFSSKTDGSDERLILDKVVNFTSSIRISPDGTKLTFNDRADSNSPLEIFVMDVNGENIEVIPSLQSDNPVLMNQFNPIWHPDSKKITFRNGPKTVTYDLETGERKEIEYGVGEFFSVNEVFENGTKFLGVYIQNNSGGPGSSALATMNIDGSDLKLLKENAGFGYITPRIYNDNTIVYMQRFNASGFFNEFWQMNLDGSNDTNLTDKLGFIQTDRLQSFTVSPEKNELLFYATNNLNFFLAKTKINGTPQPLNFQNRAIRINPQWSKITRR